MWILFVLLALAIFAVMLGFAVAAIVAVAIKLTPVFLIVFGAWLLVRAIRGPRRDRRQRDEWRRQQRQWSESGRGQVPSRRQPQPARPSSATPSPAGPKRRELPIDVQVKADQVRRKADMLLSYADRFPPFSQDLHIVQQTAADYLPRTIEAYLKLAGDHDPIVTATGRTALDELRSQLTLLDSKLDEIAQDLQRQDLNRMLANRRFLEERFRLRDQQSQQQDSSDPKADISAA